MKLKSIVLFSILFSILAVSLIYVALTRLEEPLRRDTIPSGVYIIPWMRPNPSITELNMHRQLPYGPETFKIENVMTGALKLEIVFNVNISSSIRTVQSTIYLGHDQEYLYVGGRFVGMFTNPANKPGEGMGGNFLQILFDVDHDGILSTPETGNRASAVLYEERPAIIFYYDLVWISKPSYQDGQPYWEFTDNLEDMGIHPPTFAMTEACATYENSTGTLSVLFKRLLRAPSLRDLDALQMRAGERWVMGFLLEMGFEVQGSQEPFQDYVDGWPRKIYPYASADTMDSSWCPKLAIDLSNPPATYPGVPL